MALRIRLRRMGRKKAPHYRIVIAERTMPRDGRFVDSIGHYNPRTEPMTIKIDADKAREWLERGAEPTDTVRSLLRRTGVIGDMRGAGTEEALRTAPAAPANVEPAAEEKAEPASSAGEEAETAGPERESSEELEEARAEAGAPEQLEKAKDPEAAAEVAAEPGSDAEAEAATQEKAGAEAEADAAEEAEAKDEAAGDEDEKPASA